MKKFGHNVIDVGWPGYTIKKELQLQLFKQAISGVTGQNDIVICISLGGNDMLSIPTDQLKDKTKYAAEQTIGRLVTLIGMIRDYCKKLGLKPKFIFHGYDYVHAEKEIFSIKGSLTWRFGHDMNDLEINDLMKNVLDALNEASIFIASQFDDIEFLDLRGTLNGIEDFVEDIHPDKYGYKKIAEKFSEKINSLKIKFIN